MFAMEYNGNGLRLPNETALLDDLIMIYLIVVEQFETGGVLLNIHLLFLLYITSKASVMHVYASPFCSVTSSDAKSKAKRNMTLVQSRGQFRVFITRELYYSKPL